MKAKKEHRIPLSDRAVEILTELPRERGNEFRVHRTKQGQWFVEYGHGCGAQTNGS